MNAKLLAIGAAGILLAVSAQYLLLPDWYRASEIQSSGWAIMLSVASAIVLCVAILNWEVRKLTFRVQGARRTISYVGGYLLLPFGLFLGFVIGGNCGGALGSQVLGNLGVVVGIGLGVFIVALAVSSVGVLVGYALGAFVGKPSANS